MLSATSNAAFSRVKGRGKPCETLGSATAKTARLRCAVSSSIQRNQWRSADMARATERPSTPTRRRLAMKARTVRASIRWRSTIVGSWPKCARSQSMN